MLEPYSNQRFLNLGSVSHEIQPYYSYVVRGKNKLLSAGEHPHDWYRSTQAQMDLSEAFFEPM